MIGYCCKCGNKGKLFHLEIPLYLRTIKTNLCKDCYVNLDNLVYNFFYGDE